MRKDVDLSAEKEQSKVLVVIPAYNEEESLPHTIDELTSQIHGSELMSSCCDFVVVNDGSTDSTLDVCLAYGVRVIDLPINVGLTACFQAGTKFAYRNGYDYVVQFDADGQHDPKSLEEMIGLAFESQADIVIGSRFVCKKKPLSPRMIGSSFITAMIKLTSGKNISDPTSGLRLFNRKAIERFAKDNNFAPEPDTVAFLLRKGARVEEIQVEMRERYGGQSYLTAAKSISYMMRMGISILLLQWVRK